MQFYQIEQPTTKQIFDAIINKEYVPIENIAYKAKQIEVLLKDYFNTNEVLITFDSVTNTGGIPYFFGENESLHEIAADINEDFYNLTESEQDEITELLGCYTRTYKSIFNI
jgi:hypothetical protein